jgi:hypothetical protein
MTRLYLDKRKAALVASALRGLDMRVADAEALRSTLTRDGLESWSFLMATRKGAWSVLTLEADLSLSCDSWEGVPEKRQAEVIVARTRLTRYARDWGIGAKPQPSTLRLRLSVLAA